VFVALLVLSGCRGFKSDRDSGLPPLPPRLDEKEAAAGAAQPQRSMRIAMVGEIRGELEPCGCPTVPYGGFVRRQNYLDQLRGGVAPFFHLDAGEALVKGLSTNSRDDVNDRASLILGLMDEVGVDAFTPGPSDLLALGDDWRARLATANFKSVSATWLDPITNEPLLPASVVLERDGRRLGVIGLSAKPSDPKARDKVKMLDPVEAARAAVASLPEELDLVVALSNLLPADAQRVADEVSGLAALLSTRAGRYDPPKKTDGAPIIETPDRGRYVTVLDVLLGAEGGYPLSLDESSSASLRELERTRLQLRVMAEDSPARAATAARFIALEAELAALAQGRNLLSIQDNPLGREFDDEAAVTAALDAFRGVQIDRAREVVASTPPAGPRYVTAAACTGCHAPQVAYWTYTAHVNALDSLTARESQKNPECVSCHTTGFGEIGGFADLESPTEMARFKGVQCEACHGPLSEHPGGTSGPRPVTEATCLVCHDEANSPDFDYETYLPRARCPSTN